VRRSLQHRNAFAACIAAALLAAPAAALAQGGVRDYGSRPIRLVVPVAPGGSTDVVARLIATGLGESAGLQVVVDNRAGAGGVIGSETVARAIPDGYTLLFAYASHTTMPFITKVPYDAYSDFAPVTQVAVQPLVLVVNPSLPVNNVKDLIALAKSRPKGINAGIATSGSAGHLATELFKLHTGTADGIVSVIYKGGAAAQVALLSGEVQLIFASTPSAMPYIKSGKVKMLATSATKRIAYLPELPTFAELGVPVETSPWQGILGPAKMPRAIVTRLYGQVAKLVKQPDMVERLVATGSEPVSSTPEEFAAKIKQELQEFGRIIPTLGLKGTP
jgi:tripartite-type tricarboxylate transporter receptor subunit TctC